MRLILASLFLAVALAVDRNHPYDFVRPKQMQRRFGPVFEEGRSRWFTQADVMNAEKKAKEAATKLKENSKAQEEEAKEKPKAMPLKRHQIARPSVPIASAFDYYEDDYYYYDEPTPVVKKAPLMKKKVVKRPKTKSGFGGRVLMNKRGRTGELTDISASADKSSDYYGDDYYDDYYDDKQRQGHGHGGGYGGGGGGGGGGGLSPLALLVAPLAGIALLSAAAAVALNPVLVSVSVTGRKKREADLNDVNDRLLAEKIEEMQVLEDFLGQAPKNESSQQRLLATYLTCSGFTEARNLCLDRVVCDYSSEKLSKKEKDVVSIILYNIMGNAFVDEDFKERLRTAAKSGRSFDKDADRCRTKFPCSQLDFFDASMSF